MVMLLVALIVAVLFPTRVGVLQLSTVDYMFKQKLMLFKELTTSGLDNSSSDEALDEAVEPRDPSVRTNGRPIVDELPLTELFFKC